MYVLTYVRFVATDTAVLISP